MDFEAHDRRVIEEQESRIATLEAQLAELEVENERLTRERQDSAREWRTAFDNMHQRAMTAETLSRTGAVKVLESELDWYSHTEHGALDGIPYKHVAHVIRVMLARLSAPAAPEGQQPVGVVWFGYDENTGEFTGESCSVEPHDSHRFRAYAPITTRPAEQAVTEVGAVRREIKSEKEILRRLADGDQIAFSEDGDCAFFTGGDRAFVGPVIISMRSKRYIKRITLDDENYRGTAERDVISDAGMAALNAAMEAGRHD